MEEVVKSVDALSREQMRALVGSLGMSQLNFPLLPGSTRTPAPLAPIMTPEDVRPAYCGCSGSSTKLPLFCETVCPGI